MTKSDIDAHLQTVQSTLEVIRSGDPYAIVDIDAAIRALEDARQQTSALLKSLDWTVAVSKALLPYQDRAIDAEAERDRLRHIIVATENGLSEQIHTQRRRAEHAEEEVARLRDELDRLAMKITEGERGLYGHAKFCGCDECKPRGAK